MLIVSGVKSGEVSSGEDVEGGRGGEEEEEEESEEEEEDGECECEEVGWVGKDMTPCWMRTTRYASSTYGARRGLSHRSTASIPWSI